MAEPLPGRRWVLVARWTARTIAAVLVVLIVALVFGEGIPNLLQVTASEAIQFLAFTVILAGLLLGFRWEVLGGVALLCGLVLFYATNLAASGKVPGGAFPWFFIPGLLFLMSGLSSREARRARPV